MYRPPYGAAFLGSIPAVASHRRDLKLQSYFKQSEMTVNTSNKNETLLFLGKVFFAHRLSCPFPDVGAAAVAPQEQSLSVREAFEDLMTVLIQQLGHEQSLFHARFGRAPSLSIRCSDNARGLLLG
jgi:hypothetical protein